MAEQKLTGYPSIEKPWLKYYKEGAEEKANDIPKDKTVWDVIEEKLIEYKDIPAIEYFGRVISRPEFIDMVYTWAKAFRAMGVKEDEIVAYYGPFFPDVGAMAFALNMIGACPYFLKLAISPEALAEETKECKLAIVFENMWQNISGEFSKDRFEKVIIINSFDGMAGVKKQVASLLSKLKSKAAKLPAGEKYLSVKEAKSFAKLYNGEIKAQFVPDRAAFITSSSGTTVGGMVKGIVATNEMALSLLSFGKESEIPVAPGDKFLNNFPPTAATSLHALCFTPLFRGCTIVIDPRVSPQDFYNQLVLNKPNVVLITGSMWETFFARIEAEIADGKKFDFHCASYWIVGGEGTDPHNYSRWNNVLTKCGGNPIYSGYGQSELFSATNVESPYARYDTNLNSIMSVGIPYVGITMGVFNDNSAELPYNHRGELWIKSQSAMKCYYNKPELTAKTKIDGWIHTGDLAEIDENGFVYIWGRLTDKVDFTNGKSVYLFDIANEIKKKDYINDAIVLSIETKQNAHTLVAHIVWQDDPSEQEKKNRIEELNAAIKEYAQDDYEIAGYYEYKTMLPYSPTTLKKDKNKMSQQRDGYIQIKDGKLCNISFSELSNA